MWMRLPYYLYVGGIISYLVWFIAWRRGCFQWEEEDDNIASIQSKLCLPSGSKIIVKTVKPITVITQRFKIFLPSFECIWNIKSLLETKTKKSYSKIIFMRVFEFKYMCFLLLLFLFKQCYSTVNIAGSFALFRAG